jgi:hypothetical protein
LSPSLAYGRHVRCKSNTVKKRLTVTSVGLSNVALKDENTARTTENSIYTQKVKHDLNIKST